MSLTRIHPALEALFGCRYTSLNLKLIQKYSKYLDESVSLLPLFSKLGLLEESKAFRKSQQFYSPNEHAKGFSYAILYDYPNIVEDFKTEKAEFQSPLFETAYYGDATTFSLFKALLSSSSSSRTGLMNKLGERDITNHLPIHYAIAGNQVEIIKFLLEEEKKVEKEGKASLYKPSVLLTVALKSRHPELCTLFMDKIVEEFKAKPSKAFMVYLTELLEIATCYVNPGAVIVTIMNSISNVESKNHWIDFFCDLALELERDTVFAAVAPHISFQDIKSYAQWMEKCLLLVNDNVSEVIDLEKATINAFLPQLKSNPSLFFQLIYELLSEKEDREIEEHEGMVVRLLSFIPQEVKMAAVQQASTSSQHNKKTVTDVISLFNANSHAAPIEDNYPNYRLFSLSRKHASLSEFKVLFEDYKRKIEKTPNDISSISYYCASHLAVLLRDPIAKEYYLKSVPNTKLMMRKADQILSTILLTVINHMDITFPDEFYEMYKNNLYTLIDTNSNKFTMVFVAIQLYSSVKKPELLDSFNEAMRAINIDLPTLNDEKIDEFIPHIAEINQTTYATCLLFDDLMEQYIPGFLKNEEITVSFSNSTSKENALRNFNHLLFAKQMLIGFVADINLRFNPKYKEGIAELKKIKRQFLKISAELSKIKLPSKTNPSPTTNNKTKKTESKKEMMKRAQRELTKQAKLAKKAEKEMVSIVEQSPPQDSSVENKESSETESLEPVDSSQVEKKSLEMEKNEEKIRKKREDRIARQHVREERNKNRKKNNSLESPEQSSVVPSSPVIAESVIIPPVQPARQAVVQDTKEIAPLALKKEPLIDVILEEKEPIDVADEQQETKPTQTSTPSIASTISPRKVIYVTQIPVPYYVYIPVPIRVQLDPLPPVNPIYDIVKSMGLPSITARIFNAFGSDVYLVNGAVRDYLTNISLSRTLNFVLFGNANKVSSVFSKEISFNNGEFIRINNEENNIKFEITFEFLHCWESINEREIALKKYTPRFHLTMNAMCLTFSKTGPIVLDFWGGKQDIADKRMCLIKAGDLQDIYFRHPEYYFESIHLNHALRFSFYGDINREMKAIKLRPRQFIKECKKNGTLISIHINAMKENFGPLEFYKLIDKNELHGVLIQSNIMAAGFLTFARMDFCLCFLEMVFNAPHFNDYLFIIGHLIWKNLDVRAKQALSCVSKSSYGFFAKTCKQLDQIDRVVNPPINGLK